MADGVGDRREAFPVRILDFQAGREARISGAKRDARRNADWLRGWDQVDADEPKIRFANNDPIET